MQTKQMFRLIFMLIVAFTMLLFTVSVEYAADAVNWEESAITVKGPGLTPKNCRLPSETANRAIISGQIKT